MDERDLGRGGGPGAGGDLPPAGPANTPPFGMQSAGAGGTEGGRPPSHREFPEGGEGTTGGGAGMTETQRALEEARDEAAREAAPIIAEKVQEAVAESADRLSNTMGDQVSRVAKAAKHDASRMVSEQVEQVRTRAEESINETMGRAAEGLESTARRIDEFADRYTGPDASGVRASAGNMAHQVADAFESTATYLRDNDVRKLQQDLERQVRTHPLQTLVIGVAAGWIVGKVLR